MVSGSTLSPWIRLYGRDGVLLKSVFNTATAWVANFAAPASGTYTVLVSDGNGAFFGSGTYRMTVDNLSDGLKLCVPVVSGTNIAFNLYGGLSGDRFVILTSTHVTTPLLLWSPILTNQFGRFGVLTATATNAFKKSEPAETLRSQNALDWRF